MDEPTADVRTRNFGRSEPATWSTFYGVACPFRITFQNDFDQNPDFRTKLFVAFIDVRGGGTTVLDTRQVGARAEPSWGSCVHERADHGAGGEEPG